MGYEEMSPLEELAVCGSNIDVSTGWISIFRTTEEQFKMLTDVRMEGPDFHDSTHELRMHLLFVHHATKRN